MRAYVYTDKSLGRYAGRFVWLSINTENSANAAFLQRYPIAALPTLLVIDPKENVALRYVGGATVPQLVKMLDASEATSRAKAQTSADALLAKGDRLAAGGRSTEAIAAYEEALRSAPKSWRHFARAAEALVVTQSLAGRYEPCATRASELYPRLQGTPSGANVAGTGLGCATALDAKHARRATLLSSLEQATRESLDNAKIVLSADDRSGLYMALIDAADARQDEQEVEALTFAWSAFLDDAAAKAATPEQRSVYDAHRLTAYVQLGMPDKAIAMLQQSERDFPDDYNPPARLAVAYKELGRYDDALAASDRALARVYGPRKLSVMSTRADIYEAMGDKAAARKVLEEAIAFARSLPEPQRSERRIAAMEKRVEGLR